MLQDAYLSYFQQVTYIKKLDTVTGVNSHAIENLSGILKEVLIKSGDKFKRITRDIFWLNITMYNYSELFMVIRHLEFAILQLSEQINDIMDAMQYVLLGKLPINLLSPVTLYNILKNVSLHLPEGYEIIAGNKIENVQLYYELIIVAIYGDAHHTKLILQVPLSLNNYRFILYRVTALPTRILNDTFVQYSLDFPYLGIDGI